MDSTTITQSLEAIFNPIVLAGVAIVTLAFLTGLVARLIESVEQTGRQLHSLKEHPGHDFGGEGVHDRARPVGVDAASLGTVRCSIR